MSKPVAVFPDGRNVEDIWKWKKFALDLNLNRTQSSVHIRSTGNCRKIKQPQTNTTSFYIDCWTFSDISEHRYHAVSIIPLRGIKLQIP